jgi:hypothetical protein
MTDGAADGAGVTPVRDGDMRSGDGADSGGGVGGLTLYGHCEGGATGAGDLADSAGLEYVVVRH